MTADRPQVLDAGWMVDGTGGPVRRRVRLTLVGARIASVGDPAPDPPPGGIVRRFPDDTVLPGLVDAHLHLSLSGSADPALREKQLQHAYAAAVDGMQRRIHRMLARGVVAGRDAGDAHGHALRFRRERVMDGGGTGFCLRSAGRGWHAAGRYGGFVGRPPPEGVRLGEAVLRAPNCGDHLKIVQSGINSLTVFGRQTPPQFPRPDLAAAVAAAARRGLPTMVHANGAAAVADAVDAGAASVEHGYFMGEDNLRRMADAGVAWVPTVVPMAVYARLAPGRSGDIAARTVDHQLTQIEAGHRAGVRLAVGTDAGGFGVVHGDAVIEEMALFLRAGLGLAAVVRAAAGEGARLMGLPDVGTLAPGKRACMVVAPGPPEDLPGSLKAVRLLIVDGVAMHPPVSPPDAFPAEDAADRPGFGSSPAP